VTQKDLQEKKQLLKEEEAVREEYEETEQQLDQTASSLLSTLESSLTDLGALHSKLGNFHSILLSFSFLLPQETLNSLSFQDRKRKVDQTNWEKLGNFKDELSAKTSGMEESLVAFQESQASQLQKLISSLDQYKTLNCSVTFSSHPPYDSINDQKERKKERKKEKKPT